MTGAERNTHLMSKTDVNEVVEVCCANCDHAEYVDVALATWVCHGCGYRSEVAATRIRTLAEIGSGRWVMLGVDAPAKAWTDRRDPSLTPQGERAAQGAVDALVHTLQAKWREAFVKPGGMARDGWRAVGEYVLVHFLPQTAGQSDAAEIEALRKALADSEERADEGRSAESAMRRMLGAYSYETAMAAGERVMGELERTLKEDLRVREAIGCSSEENITAFAKNVVTGTRKLLDAHYTESMSEAAQRVVNEREAWRSRAGAAELTLVRERIANAGETLQDATVYRDIRKLTGNRNDLSIVGAVAYVVGQRDAAMRRVNALQRMVNDITNFFAKDAEAKA